MVFSFTKRFSKKSKVIKTSKTTGKQNELTAKVNRPDAYKKLLTPEKGKQRMVVNPDLPKNLTPKGYTKMQLIMSIANKQYEGAIKRLKGTGKMWEDPDFPANGKSIGNLPSLGKIEWLRPKQINPRAEFMIGEFDRSDVQQGMLGDCWLLAVISSIASYPQLLKHVVPPDQDMQGDDYVGIYKFRFWRFGQWIEVLVDDRLPVKANTKQLLFMHSDDAGEMWSALLEKAYAKLAGSYANLAGGSQAEAMEDLTGGMCETITLEKENHDEFLKRITQYSKQCCLMGCSITSKVVEAKLKNGLIAGHAYSVTAVDTIDVKGKKQWLVRCRNPWGNNYEWNGAWSDRSAEWANVSADEKKRLDVSVGGDGEFWMAYEDFIKDFTKLEVCHLGLESLEADTTIRGKRRLEEALFAGEWVGSTTAGGCMNFKDTFWMNPQFRITVTDPDPDDDVKTCSVRIGLMQKDMRSKSGGQYLTIGFVLYKLDHDAEGVMGRQFFQSRAVVARSEFVNTREVVASFNLRPGAYIIVPSTFKPNEECKFMIRVLTQVAIEESELDDNNTLRGLPDSVVKALKLEEAIRREDEEVDRQFYAAAGKRKIIIAQQLQKILNESSLKELKNFKGFSFEVIRSMIAAMDNNQTGTMEYSEFKDLWECCQAWKIIFNQRDKDNSGNFNIFEFREALDDAGYNVSNQVFNVIVQRYTTITTQTVSVEDFFLCLIRLKNAMETAEAQKKDVHGHLRFNKNDYLRFSLYI